MPAATTEQIDSFITRWENSGAGERANYQMFLSELCDILDVLRPDPTSPDPAKNLYVFDRALERAFHQGRGYITSPHGFPVLVSGLWKQMATGTAYSALLFKEIACFNGGLFENTTALPLSAAQLAMLTDAAGTDWSAVEPSIFGTLLTRALDPRERHKLGAEYTPRSYVERLIRPTIIEPLRDEWDAVRIAAANLRATSIVPIVGAIVRSSGLKPPDWKPCQALI